MGSWNYKMQMLAAVAHDVGAAWSHIYVSHETNANGLFSNTTYSGRAFERDPIIVPLLSPQYSI